MNVSLFKNLTHALNLLPRGTSRKLGILCLFQIGVALLDVLAILMLGSITKSGLEYVQNERAELPIFLTQKLNLESLDFETQFTLLAGLICIIFLFRTIISILGNNKIYRYLGKQASYASNQLLEKMFKARPDYLLSKNSQELLYGQTSGIDNLVLTLLGSTTLLLTELFFLTSVLILILIIQPVTAICSLLIFGITFHFIQKSTLEKGRIITQNLGNLTVSYNQEFLETLSIFRELVLRGKVDTALGVLCNKRYESLKLRAQLLLIPMTSKYLFELVLILGGFTVALVQLLISDALGAISSLVIFLAAASRIMPSIVRVQGALLSIRQSEGASEITVKQILEVEDILKFKFGKPYQSDLKKEFIPRVELSKVNFAYENSNNFRLEDISLDIAPGTFIAIVGESGAGKTTLIDLMIGMLQPTSGSIKISGLEPLDAAANWPGYIAYVPQDISIIDGSIRKNITLDVENLGLDSEVYFALQKARLLEDVYAMSTKLDEVVGEKGTRLSGGQRQRLGIARALLSKPKLIVFDEATSALDTITEKAITESIFNRDNETTLIVIAHRLSTVKNADLVVFVEKGRILAAGSFDQVRKIAPRFDQQAKLVNL